MNRTKNSPKMVEVVKNRVRGSKKWFLLVDNPLRADVRVEILKTKRIYVLAYSLGRSIAYYIEYRYDFSGETRDKMTITSSSPQIAAKDILRALKSMCDAYLGSESGFWD